MPHHTKTFAMRTRTLVATVAIALLLTSTAVWGITDRWPHTAVNASWDGAKVAWIAVLLVVVARSIGIYINRAATTHTDTELRQIHQLTDHVTWMAVTPPHQNQHTTTREQGRRTWEEVDRAERAAHSARSRQ